MARAAPERRRPVLSGAVDPRFVMRLRASHDTSTKCRLMRASARSRKAARAVRRRPLYRCGELLHGFATARPSVAQPNRSVGDGVSISELGSLGEIIGSIAVLVTLIILVFQVRGARIELSSQMTRAWVRRPRTQRYRLPAAPAELGRSARGPLRGFS